MDLTTQLTAKYVTAISLLQPMDLKYLVSRYGQGPGANRVEINVANPNSGAVFGLLFGDCTITLQRTRVYNAIRMIG